MRAMALSLPQFSLALNFILFLSVIFCIVILLSSFVPLIWNEAPSAESLGAVTLIPPHLFAMAEMLSTDFCGTRRMRYRVIKRYLYQ